MVCLVGQALIDWCLQIDTCLVGWMDRHLGDRWWVVWLVTSIGDCLDQL